MDKLYKKRGRRYVEIGHEFTGFPANGIWMVEDGRNNCIIRIEEINHNTPLRLFNYRKHQDAILEKVMKTSNGSMVDIVEKCCDYFAELSEKNPE